MTKFVNPYTFVPLPDSIKKEQLQLHDGSGAKKEELYTGSFIVEWELKSPLLLPEKAEEEGWLELTGEKTGKIRVPGSSVKGAMRSLHEAIFFGCMSVVDKDYIPVYREAAIKGKRTDDEYTSTNNEKWVIGVVEKVDDQGKPLCIRRTEGKTIWINAEGLLRTCQRQNAKELPQTGDAVRFRGSDVKVKNNRATVYEPREFAQRRDGNIDEYSPDDHVVIITDGATRRNMRTWYWASRKIDIGSSPLSISDEAWKHFQAKVDGTDDRRREKLKNNEKKVTYAANKVDVKGLGKKLGKRLSQNGIFSPGDALWVKIDNAGDKEHITELSYSAIWRRVAVFPKGEEKSGEVIHVGDLLGDLSPCDPNDAEHGVCLSCSLFGAVGPEKEGGEKGLGYASHVSFGSLELKGNEANISAKKEIMPLSSPKPSNGQFYMTNPRKLQDKPNRDMVDDGETTSHWDRRKIENVERKLAGRKFYWNHDPLRRHHGRVHYEKFNGAKDKLITKRRLVFVGNNNNKTVLKGEVTFDQITGAQLASLWCLLNPASLFESFKVKGPHAPVVRLGGGKPLGFGSVAPSIISYKVFRSKERYLDDGAEFDSDRDSSASTALGVAADRWNNFVKDIEERVIPDGNRKKFVDNVRKLTRLMDLDGLGDVKDLVTYPPNASWEQYGSEDFHKSYKFFACNQGAARHRNRRTYWSKWKSLPILTPTDYSQPRRDDQTLEW